ncbi:Uncharacterized protein APZ42_003077, partial [Daphnia magna]
AAVELRHLYRPGEAGGGPEHHVGLARPLAARGSRADEDVVDPVAVHVPRGTDGCPGLVAGVFAIDPKAVAAVERGQLELGGETVRAAEDHIGAAGIDSEKGGADSPDD